MKGRNLLENYAYMKTNNIIKWTLMRENLDWIELEEDKPEVVRSQLFEVYKMRVISLPSLPSRVKVTLVRCEMTTCRTVAKFMFIFPQKGDN
jgi:hypothetical protein